MEVAVEHTPMALTHSLSLSIVLRPLLAACWLKLFYVWLCLSLPQTTRRVAQLQLEPLIPLPPPLLHLVGRVCLSYCWPSLFVAIIGATAIVSHESQNLICVQGHPGLSPTQHLTATQTSHLERQLNVAVAQPPPAPPSTSFPFVPFVGLDVLSTNINNKVAHNAHSSARSTFSRILSISASACGINQTRQ